MIQCFTCTHDYFYIGGEPHPGVCVNCGSRCVSLSGEPTIESVELHEPAVESFDTYLDVELSDATDRAFYYLFSVCDDDIARLDLIQVEESQLNGEHGWPDELLSNNVIEAVEAAGYAVPGRAVQTD